MGLWLVIYPEKPTQASYGTWVAIPFAGTFPHGGSRPDKVRLPILMARTTRLAHMSLWVSLYVGADADRAGHGGGRRLPWRTWAPGRPRLPSGGSLQDRLEEIPGPVGSTCSPIPTANSPCLGTAIGCQLGVHRGQNRGFTTSPLGAQRP